MDPRIRQRRIEVRRAQGRRRLRAVLAIGVAVLLGAVTWGALHSSLFAVRHVQVSGNRHTSTAEVLAVTGLDRHQPMIDVAPGRLERKLEALPWVARATVSRHWPDAVSVSVQERVAVARQFQPGGTTALVDASGRVVAVRATATLSAAASRLPVVDGLSAAQPGQVVGPVALARSELAVSASLPPALRGKVTAVSVSRGGNLEAEVSPAPGSQLRVLLGDTTQLADKDLALETMLARVPMTGVSTIDVRVPGAPVLTRGGVRTSVSTTSGG